MMHAFYHPISWLKIPKEKENKRRVKFGLHLDLRLVDTVYIQDFLWSYTIQSLLEELLLLPDLLF